MRTHLTIVAAVLLCGSAQAQDSGLGFTVGLKAWATDWSGFTYTGPVNDRVLTPVQAEQKVVWIPSASVRWGSLVASVSGYAPTEYAIERSSARDRRREADYNLAWLLTPGLALSLGYKQLAQIAEFSYKPAGPVLGASGSAPLGGTLALYGNLGIGRLQTPARRNDFDVEFKAEYRLLEAGLAWTLPVERFVSAASLTLGYRMQVLVSKDAGRDNQVGLDARDITEGLTLGFTARF